jgi:hypothetical protein
VLAARSALALILGGATAACAEAPPPPRTATTSSSAQAVTATTATPPAKPAADVDVQVRAPLHARYSAGLLGAGHPSLAIVVTNRGSEPLDVSSLRVHLEARRDGISFGCAEEAAAPAGEREPAALRPGESFTFDRELDCALPLLGAYSVKVSVSFGHADWAAPREARAFVLTVSALAGIEPRRVEAVPGLWASLGASATLPGAPPGSHGRIVVSLISSAKKPLELPPLRLGFRVTRVGSTIACEDEPIPLATPAVLPVGAIHRQPVEVSCLGLGVPGTYDVAARLIVPRGSDLPDAYELGRLRIEVTSPSYAPWTRP